MTNILKNLFDIFSTPTLKELENRYLCESVDNIDLERRMREVQNGKAPFQRSYY